MARRFAFALLAGTSILATAPALAQDDVAGAQNDAADADDAADVPPEDADAGSIIVTGSRVIRNGNDSPTPVTTLTVEALQASKPTTLFDALLEQPLIASAKGGRVAGSTAMGGNNNSIAALNLRGLGLTRGLVLYDGHRVPPQNLDGTVDLNQIPDMLLQRVDLQTGGSSAVYGSDAITGVVNFITDRTFTGWKVEANSGISQRGDGAGYKVGVAWGTNFLDGRAHFQASAQYRDDQGMLRTDRDNVQQDGRPAWSLGGNGCPTGTAPAACAPFFVSDGVVDSLGSFGGKINRVTGQPTFLAGTTNWYGYNFTANGVATPFVAGTPVPGGNNQVGGQGGFASQGTSLAADVDFAQLYGRFDFDVTDHVRFYATAFYVREHQFNFNSNVRANGSSASNALASGFRLTPDNAFLPAQIATNMRAAGITVFQLGKYFDSRAVLPANTNYTNKNRYINTGFEGDLAGFNWELSYTDSRIVQSNTANQSWDTARLFAALDSVVVNGVPTCRVATLPQYASLYPNCVPFNPFGPDTVTPEMIAYVSEPTEFVGITEQQNGLASISGSPFSLWAGEVLVGVSAEWRKLTYELKSDAEPANVPGVALNCDALGIPNSRTSCVNQARNAAGQLTNVGTTPIYPNGTAGRTPVSQEVKEIAAEIDIPLIRDWSIFQDLRLSLAARYADYESTGNVIKGDPYVSRTFSATTWKAGLNWQANYWLKLRGTISRDFRAPNLSDLFLPGRTQGAANGQQDLLTGATTGTTVISGATYTNIQSVGGNPELQPEVGHTITAGVVLTPTANFSVALDFYDITIDDAITIIDGSAPAYQNACYDSGGTSPFCLMQQRPGGFDRTPANQALTNSATLFYTAVPFNLAQIKTHGVDFEANYGAEIAGQNFQARLLASWQPTLKSILASTPTTDAAGVSLPEWRLQVSLGYNFTDELRVDWTTRWRSGLKNVDPLLGLQVAPGSLDVDSVSFSNLNVSYDITEEIKFYFNIQNVFDTKPPVYAPNGGGSPFAASSGTGGVGFYPADDWMGRYFIIGARAKF